MSERTDGDRLIVTGYSGGSHFPRTQAATQYRFEADGLSNEGPFQVEGAIYGRDLSFRGPGTVKGPVMGRGDARLHNHSDRPLRFLAGLHVSGNIGVVSRAGALEDSLVATLDRADIVVRGDVIADHVSLENTIVIGNVRGRQVRLAHCIVLGMVIAEEAAIIQASTFLGYRAPDVTFEGPCTALFAMGLSDRTPVFREYRDGAGRVWPCDVRFYPVFREAAGSPLTNRGWSATGDAYLRARIVPEDWIGFEADKPVTRIEGDKRVEGTERVSRVAFTIAGRALNFGPIEAQLTRMTQMLKTALEFNHYHPNDQQTVRRDWEDRLTPDEVRVLRLATDTELAPAGVAPAKAPRTAVRSVAIPSSVTSPTPAVSAVAAPAVLGAQFGRPPPHSTEVVPAGLGRAANQAAAPITRNSPGSQLGASQPTPLPASPLRSPTLGSTGSAPRSGLRAAGGVDAPASAKPSPTAGEPGIATPPPRRSMKVRLTDGTSRVGAFTTFEPTSGTFGFLEDPDAQPVVVPLDTVLLIVVPSTPAIPRKVATVHQIEVTLTGGQKVIGATDSRIDDATGVLVVPDDRSGNIDWAWVGRAAIAAIQPR